MRTHNRQSVSETRRRRAFTLVEMLVAATLILLMMTLFGQIFGLATNSMNLQRAIAENDQQIRTLTTVLRGDLQKRTFRNFVPFFPLESQDDPSIPFQGREGYFYLSLNDAGNSVDNVLQFTVRSTIVDELIDDTPYYGSAITLGGAGAFLANQNQPEHDDGEINPNGAGSSAAAEVCYFVRGGNLYRRQMLLREPLPASGADTEQPTRSDDIDFFAPNTPAGANPLYTSTQFWEHFDYSSVLRFRGADHPSGAGPDGAGFIGLESLSNETELPPVATPAAPLLQQIPLRGGATPLGQSRYRFGFDPFTGLSREFGDAAGTFFIGRFSHEESSSTDFTYPHVFPGSPTPVGTGNPMDTVGTPLTDNGEGRVSEFVGGTRIGEDLLLTNVHEFRIDVWDARLQAFVEPGHTLPPNRLGQLGDYHASRRLGVSATAPAPLTGALADNRPTEISYAPIGGSGAVIDTWHANYDFDNRDGNFYDTPNVDGSGPDNPPFRPMNWDPLGFCAPVPVYSSASAPSGSQWEPGVEYEPGEVVFPPTEDTNYNGILEPAEDGVFPYIDNQQTGGLADFDVSGQDGQAHGRAFYYVCLQKSANSPPVTTLPGKPVWSKTPGQLIRTSDGYIWQVQSNLRPLSAIRITVRFLHRRSGKMRQMTILHPLVK